MKKRKSRHVEILEAALANLEAALAKLRAAEQDKSAGQDNWDALTDASISMIEALRQVAVERAFPHERAAAIRREIAARADQLRRSGERNPVTQAREEAAERWDQHSVEALNRWLRRHP